MSKPTNGHTLPHTATRERPSRAREPDVKTAHDAVRTLLVALGEDPDRPGLVETPSRVVRALLELTRGTEQDPHTILERTFPEPGRGVVELLDIPFTSLCEHHLLPFRGRAHVAYLPTGRVVGISKLARVVQAIAHRLQLQERLTREVAEAIETALAPDGVGVVVEAEHACLSLRGARVDARLRTHAWTGRFETDDALRRTFLHAIDSVPLRSNR